jgi:hypothetical protein
LRTNIAAQWTSWQTAITNGGMNYTLPTVPAQADIEICNCEQKIVSNYPIISISWVAPRVIGAQVGVTNDWTTTIQVQVAWWLLHDGTPDSKLTAGETLALIQQDIKQMVLLMLRNTTTGLTSQTGYQITACEEVDGETQIPRTTNGNYALRGDLLLELTQDAQYQ